VHHIVKDIYVIFEKSLNYFSRKVVEESIGWTRSCTHSAVQTSEKIFFESEIGFYFFYYSYFFLPRNLKSFFWNRDIISIFTNLNLLSHF